MSMYYLLILLNCIQAFRLITSMSNYPNFTLTFLYTSFCLLSTLSLTYYSLLIAYILFIMPFIIELGMEIYYYRLDPEDRRCDKLRLVLEKIVVNYKKLLGK